MVAERCESEELEDRLKVALVHLTTVLTYRTGQDRTGRTELSHRRLYCNVKLQHLVSQQKFDCPKFSNVRKCGFNRKIIQQ